MSPVRRLPVVFLLALAACGGGEADTLAERGQREAAAMRGEPAPGASADPDPAHGACSRAGGEWQPASGTCKVTRPVCALSAGTWTDAGCTVDVAGEAGCTGFSGMRWTQGRCILESMDKRELSDAGF